MQAYDAKATSRHTQRAHTSACFVRHFTLVGVHSYSACWQGGSTPRVCAPPHTTKINARRCHKRNARERDQQQSGGDKGDDIVLIHLHHVIDLCVLCVHAGRLLAGLGVIRFRATEYSACCCSSSRHRLHTRSLPRLPPLLAVAVFPTALRRSWRARLLPPVHLCRVCWTSSPRARQAWYALPLAHRRVLLRPQTPNCRLWLVHHASVGGSRCTRAIRSRVGLETFQDIGPSCHRLPLVEAQSNQRHCVPGWRTRETSLLRR